MKFTAFGLDFVKDLWNWIDTFIASWHRRRLETEYLDLSGLFGPRPPRLGMCPRTGFRTAVAGRDIDAKSAAASRYDKLLEGLLLVHRHCRQ